LQLSQVLDVLANDAEFREAVADWRILPAQPARLEPLPGDLDARLGERLRARGVGELYSHQAEAYNLARAGHHVVSLTPTASGKSLGYALPVLQGLAEDPSARALMLFPTKALAQDQLAALAADMAALGPEFGVGTYDGDTPPTERRQLRRAGHVVLTNPDMLHAAILPHHTQWVHLFEHLRYVVLDELHTYRGVFGAHVAQVLRRLRRLCEFYGSSPQFLATSATVSDAEGFASRLFDAPVRVVRESGAPRGERHVVLLRPRLIDAATGRRRSTAGLADDLVLRLAQSGVATIMFCRSRQSVELHTRALKDRLGRARVEGYRGGYLPSERRAIEAALRDGTLRCVVSTNALELGVDIGALDAAVVVGYPGTIASLWQEAGRAGRRGEVSALFLLATPSPLDQYLADHPAYLHDQDPEAPTVNPDNRYILMDHLKCAAFELPFAPDDRFSVATTPEMLDALAQAGILRHTGGRYYWATDGYPAQAVSLRSGPGENFVVIEQTDKGPRVLGEVDRPSAPTRLHEQAIYMHAGRTYEVEKLDYADRKAFVRAVDADYYTEAEMAGRLEVLRLDEEVHLDVADAALGDVEVSFLPTIFKKITFEGHENVGWGPIHLPEEHLPTVAAWWTLKAPLAGPPTRTASALAGAGYVLSAVASLFLMCDPRDIGVSPEVRDPRSGLPTLYLYDMVPGGVGLAEAAFRRGHEMFGAALERVRACPCDSGCPSCVGPGRDAEAKPAAAELLEAWSSVLASAHAAPRP
jgi:DEAD/DEAH box helicase domain-containing protein